MLRRLNTSAACLCDLCLAWILGAAAATLSTPVSVDSDIRAGCVFEAPGGNAPHAKRFRWDLKILHDSSFRQIELHRHEKPDRASAGPGEAGYG